MKTIIIVLSIFVLLFGLGLYFQFKRDQKLKNSKKTVAIITWCGKAINGGARISFELNGKRINTRVLNGDFRSSSVGDSILIKYAIEDPELIEVIDKHW